MPLVEGKCDSDENVATDIPDMNWWSERKSSKTITRTDAEEGCIDVGLLAKYACSNEKHWEMSMSHTDGGEFHWYF